MLRLERHKRQASNDVAGQLTDMAIIKKFSASQRLNG
jgi:hypothetical protein